METNNGSIVNSRVGGDAVQRIVEIGGLKFVLFNANPAVLEVIEFMRL